MRNAQRAADLQVVGVYARVGRLNGRHRRAVLLGQAPECVTGHHDMGHRASWAGCGSALRDAQRAANAQGVGVHAGVRRLYGRDRGAISLGQAPERIASHHHMGDRARRAGCGGTGRDAQRAADAQGVGVHAGVGRLYGGDRRAIALRQAPECVASHHRVGCHARRASECDIGAGTSVGVGSGGRHGDAERHANPQVVGRHRRVGRHQRLHRHTIATGNAPEGVAGHHHIGHGAGGAAALAGGDANAHADLQVVGVQRRVGGNEIVDRDAVPPSNAVEGVAGLNDIDRAVAPTAGGDAEGLTDVNDVPDAGVGRQNGGHRCAVEPGNAVKGIPFVDDIGDRTGRTGSLRPDFPVHLRGHGQISVCVLQAGIGAWRSILIRIVGYHIKSSRIKCGNRARNISIRESDELFRRSGLSRRREAEGPVHRSHRQQK